MVNIRPALRDDLDFIVNAQINMAEETEKLRLNVKTVKNGVEAVFNDSAKGKYYVALVNGELAGCLLTMPEWSDWRNGSVLWIHSVYTGPKFRGQGVYKKLYSYLQELVNSDDSLRGLRLYVDKTNFSAQKVYQQLGMSNQHYELYEWMK